MEPDHPVDTAHGPPVGTTARFPAGAVATLWTLGPDEPVSPPPKLVVDLFALGLRTPEPDRAGWVTIAELDIDDRVTFTVGATAVHGDPAGRPPRCGTGPGYGACGTPAPRNTPGGGAQCRRPPALTRG